MGIEGHHGWLGLQGLVHAEGVVVFVINIDHIFLFTVLDGNWFMVDAMLRGESSDGLLKFVKGRWGFDTLDMCVGLFV